MDYYILKEANLKVKHQRKAAYKQVWSKNDGEALQVKNKRFCCIFMPLTSEKLRGHIGLGLSLCPSVRPSVCL